MVYVVKYRLKNNDKETNARVAKTLFAESNGKPSREKAVELLKNVTGGDFLEETIQIQELQDFDPAEIRKHGATVFNLSK
jgi:hypothetical protein